MPEVFLFVKNKAVQAKTPEIEFKVHLKFLFRYFSL